LVEHRKDVGIELDDRTRDRPLQLGQQGRGRVVDAHRGQHRAVVGDSGGGAGIRVEEAPTGLDDRRGDPRRRVVAAEDRLEVVARIPPAADRADQHAAGVEQDAPHQAGVRVS
jgi:hypothetical protein